MRRIAVALTVLALVAAACSSSDDGGSSSTTTEEVASSEATTETTTAPTAPVRSFAGTEPAPEFPDGLDWLNTEAPLSLSQLRGKVVVLDFWTYGCINCIHVIPDLKQLEAEYADELVVIGVHSAKFENEAETENIRNIILRYDLEHPVVNDRDFIVWRTWGARAWPTLVIIDPAGNVVGGHSGEGIYEIFQPVIQSLVDEFDERGTLDRGPVHFALEKDGLPDSVLSFPGKVVVDGDAGRLYVADTNHHRVVVADLETGEVVDVFGSGTRGLRDGVGTAARFDQPQGMALGADGELFVADVGNHSIRSIDLATGAVATLVGTGEQAPFYPPQPGIAPDVALSSPWALEAHGTDLYIAMAGSHQIWRMDLASAEVVPFAGSGREGTVNTARLAAELAQPSGLAIDDLDRLVFADSESSAIRYVELGDDGSTGLLSGSDDGLFDFGDVDGPGVDARLQHPLGVAFDGTSIYITDTYNSKIKRIDPATGDTATFSGGEPGWADGVDARFDEPGGIDHWDGHLYVADTNNHAVRVIDIATGEVSTLVLFGVERFESPDDGFEGTVVRLDPVTVAAGEGSIVLEVGIPAGYKVNDIAPFSMTWTSDGDAVALTDDASQSIVEPTFPVEAMATFTGGEATLSADITVYYCTADEESLCFIERLRAEVPVVVGDTGDSVITVPYEIVAPAL